MTTSPLEAGLAPSPHRCRPGPGCTGRPPAAAGPSAATSAWRFSARHLKSPSARRACRRCRRSRCRPPSRPDAASADSLPVTRNGTGLPASSPQPCTCTPKSPRSSATGAATERSVKPTRALSIARSPSATFQPPPTSAAGEGLSRTMACRPWLRLLAAAPRPRRRNVPPRRQRWKFQLPSLSRATSRRTGACTAISSDRGDARSRCHRCARRVLSSFLDADLRRLRVAEQAKLPEPRSRAWHPLSAADPPLSRLPLHAEVGAERADERQLEEGDARYGCAPRPAATRRGRSGRWLRQRCPGPEKVSLPRSLVGAENTLALEDDGRIERPAAWLWPPARNR